MNHITLSVIDVERSFIFYRDVIGQTPLVRWHKDAYFLDPDGHKLEIHVGTPEERIAAQKANLCTWQDVEWFV